MEWIKGRNGSRRCELSDNNNPSEDVCYIQDHRNKVEHGSIGTQQKHYPGIISGKEGDPEKVEGINLWPL